MMMMMVMMTRIALGSIDGNSQAYLPVVHVPAGKWHHATMEQYFRVLKSF
jgi:hypothetical protein